MYNEVDVIPELLDKLALVLSTLEFSSEIVIVEGGGWLSAQLFAGGAEGAIAAGRNEPHPWLGGAIVGPDT